MATILKLLGWKAKGFRCPDHEVSFEKKSGEVYRISLIQMPNGTGKTTTLELLRAALSGAATTWEAERIRALQKQKSKAARGEFQVFLLHDRRRLTITLQFDFEEGTVAYQTTGTKGLDDGFHPPRDLAKFFRPEFIRFFVFDGELADHLLDKDRTDAQTAIEALFELTLLDGLNGAVHDHWERQTRKSGAKASKGYTQRANRVESLRDRLKQQAGEQAKLSEQLEKASRELARKDRKFSEAIAQQKEYRERLTKAEDGLEKAKQRVADATKGVLARMRNPHALSCVYAKEMLAFKDSLDRVKLPESAAREFFQELAAESHCVCGREFDEASRKALLERAQHYLGSDNVSLLNSLKKDISDLVGEEPSIHQQELNGELQGLLNSMRQEEQARGERDRIRTEASRDDPELEKAKEELGELQKQKAGMEERLRKYDDTSDSDDSTGIGVLRKRLAQAENDLAEVTQTLELRAKRDVLSRILVKAKGAARNGISAEVCNEANRRVAELMPNNAIRIQGIESCLILKGQEAGSVGENLSTAYAFLSTLFNRSEHRLPFVVDSPANPIDLAVRGKVGRLVPKLTDQFVAFTISSEREGFLPALEEVGRDDIQYLTFFRKSNKELEASARKEKAVQETQDGLCVPGRKYFREFHRDEE